MASTGTSPRVVAIPVPAAKHAIYATGCVAAPAEEQLPNSIRALCRTGRRFAEDDNSARQPFMLQRAVVQQAMVPWAMVQPAVSQPGMMMLKTRLRLMEWVGAAERLLAIETIVSAQTATRL
jgi:hypothetical protein